LTWLPWVSALIGTIALGLNVAIWRRQSAIRRAGEERAKRYDELSQRFDTVVLELETYRGREATALSAMAAGLYDHDWLGAEIMAALEDGGRSIGDLFLQFPVPSAVALAVAKLYKGEAVEIIDGDKITPTARGRDAMTRLGELGR
jgi:hypothetical protein